MKPLVKQFRNAALALVAISSLGVAGCATVNNVAQGMPARQLGNRPDALTLACTPGGATFTYVDREQNIYVQGFLGTDRLGARVNGTMQGTIGNANIGGSFNSDWGFRPYGPPESVYSGNVSFERLQLKMNSIGYQAVNEFRNQFKNPDSACNLAVKGPDRFLHGAAREPYSYGGPR